MMKKRISLLFLFLYLFSSSSQAGIFELSATGMLDKRTYDKNDFVETKTAQFSIAYYISNLAQIELAYQYSKTRTYIENYQDTIFRDKVYSANLIFGVLGRENRFQPYVKAGVAQLNRDAEGSYASGAYPPKQVDQLSLVLGAGFKFFLTQQFALKGEATSLIVGDNSVGDNVIATAGVSFFF